MARTCTVCVHEDRASIDAAIVEGALSLRDRARRWSVSKDAAMRHRAHVSAALVAVKHRREARGAETLVDRVERLYSRASAILDAAEKGGHTTVALAAVRELRGIVETLGKLTGELDERPTVNVLNVLATDDWQQVRGALLATLMEWPEARAAVADRLLALEASLQAVPGSP